MSTQNTSTLEITDLHVSITTPDGTEKEILKGVNLTVNSGETHAVMGPNGQGPNQQNVQIVLPFVCEAINRDRDPSDCSGRCWHNDFGWVRRG